MSRQSCLSPEKGDNEVKLGTERVTLGIYWRELRNTLARKPAEGRTTSHRLEWGLLSLNEISMIAQHIMEKACCPWNHGLRQKKKKNFMLVWRCHQLLPVRLPSQRPLAPSRSVMIRVITKWSRGLCTDLLAFALKPRKTPENLSHRLKWDPFPPNEVGRISQHVRKGEEREKRMGRVVSAGRSIRPTLRLRSVQLVRSDRCKWLLRK